MTTPYEASTVAFEKWLHGTDEEVESLAYREAWDQGVLHGRTLSEPTTADVDVVMVFECRTDSTDWEGLREALAGVAKALGYKISHWGPAPIMKRALGATLASRALNGALNALYGDDGGR